MCSISRCPRISCRATRTAKFRSSCSFPWPKSGALRLLWKRAWPRATTSVDEADAAGLGPQARVARPDAHRAAFEHLAAALERVGLEARHRFTREEREVRRQDHVVHCIERAQRMALPGERLLRIDVQRGARDLLFNQGFQQG